MNKERPQARSFFVPGKGRYDPGQPEDGEDGEDGGDNGDADAPVGEDAAPVAPQSSEDGESNEVVSPVTKENAVAQIGDTYYATLTAALEAANDGDTVKMLKDYTSDKNDLFTMIFVKKQLTLDLNGFDEEDGKYAVVTFHQHGYHGTAPQHGKSCTERHPRQRGADGQDAGLHRW